MVEELSFLSEKYRADYLLYHLIYNLEEIDEN